MKRVMAIFLAFLFFSVSLGSLSACKKKEEPATPETTTAPAPMEEAAPVEPAAPPEPPAAPPEEGMGTMEPAAPSGEEGTTPQ